MVLLYFDTHKGRGSCHRMDPGNAEDHLTKHLSCYTALVLLWAMLLMCTCPDESGVLVQAAAVDPGGSYTSIYRQSRIFSRGPLNWIMRVLISHDVRNSDIGL